MPLRAKDAELFVGTRTFRFGPGDSRVAWSIGEGPLIVLVHGWGGRGSQMAGLARFLAAEGYRCVVFDAGGHGDSRTESVGYSTFISDSRDLARAINEQAFAWIGHSAGALGMMHARALHGICADRYVCISAPRFPYVALDVLQKHHGASDEVLEHVKPILAAQFQTGWLALEEGEAFVPEPEKPLLLAYDRDDKLVRHADADFVAARWPGATVVKTDGYGHNRILRAPEVWEAAREFLRAPV